MDTKALFQQIMPKLYEYIMDTELTAHPNNPHIIVLNNEESLSFNNNPNRMHSLSYEAILWRGLVPISLDTKIRSLGQKALMTLMC